MASVAEKLYPPVIGASIPAFYNNNGTVLITVPFSMNRAVSASDVHSFTLKIKTAQSNSFIKTLSTENDSNSTSSFISNRVVKFYWENVANDKDFKKLKIGQFVKIQLAYNLNDTNKTVGYFSTVAIGKYTSMPNIYIKNAIAENDINGIPIFKQSYTGVYQLTEDKNERPYSYNFYLYDSNQGLVETSGWQLHNTSVNNSASESLQLKETTDTYRYKTSLSSNSEYYIQYGVRTINNLEVFSPLYTCIESADENTDLTVDLIAENNFEEGYITLRLKRKEQAEAYLDKSISIEISRAEVGYSEYIDNLEAFEWQPLKRVYFAIQTSYDDIEQRRFKDYTVEQGVRYLYCFKQYNDQNIFTSRVISNVIEADFEDMFLYDGKLQLKIRFNPKVSSFKVTRQEQKIDTIGSKFPFMFRNGIVEYKEFPIGGLISYYADNNKEFFKDEDDLNIIRADEAFRYERTPIREVTYEVAQVDENNYEYNKYYIFQNNKYRIANELLFTDYAPGTVFYSKNVNYQDDSWKTTQTLDSIGYNMRAERKFKLKLLDWLGNGQIKLFRSPAEGNYLVRLMNISLTPEDKLGRMLHSFTATAFEVEELTYQNLINLGFINVDNYEETKIGTKSVLFKEIVEDYITTTNINNFASIKINDGQIVNLLSIEPTKNTNSTSFYVRIGEDSLNERALVRTGRFNLNIPGKLPDIYFNIDDNMELMNLPNNPQKADYISETQTLLGDALLTYEYEITNIETGDIGDITNVYVRNKIGSLIGPYTLDRISNSSSTQTTEIIRYYVLNFLRKEIRDIYYNDGHFYEDEHYSLEISHFDTNVLYRVGTTIYYSLNGSSLSESFSESSSEDQRRIRFGIEDENGVITVQDYYDIPLVDLRTNKIKYIYLGAYYQLDYAYQEKITLIRGE